MKMNKLFASVATAAVVLSAVAPATVANAATGSNGSGVLSKDFNAEANSDQSAVGTSYASVNVVSDVLSLDQVPDFNFDPAVAGTTANLKNNVDLGTGKGDHDGNNQGILQVTDSRTGEDGTKGLGYTLTASLGNFGPDLAAGQNDAFVMTLPSQDAEDNGNGQRRVHFNGNALTSDATAKQVMNVAAGTGFGSSKFQFGLGTGVKMFVPEGVAKGAYSAPITWTLSVLPSAPAAAPEAPAAPDNGTSDSGNAAE